MRESVAPDPEMKIPDGSKFIREMRRIIDAAVPIPSFSASRAHEEDDRNTVVAALAASAGGMPPTGEDGNLAADQIGYQRRQPTPPSGIVLPNYQSLSRLGLCRDF